VACGCRGGLLGDRNLCCGLNIHGLSVLGQRELAVAQELKQMNGIVAIEDPGNPARSRWVQVKLQVQVCEWLIAQRNSPSATADHEASSAYLKLAFDASTVQQMQNPLLFFRGDAGVHICSCRSIVLTKRNREHVSVVDRGTP